MTRRERKEQKIKKRLAWAKARENKANQELEAGDNIAKHIPFGQPILKGHHSQKRHENDLKKIRRHGEKSVENSKMAEHHRYVADNIQHQLDTTIFSDDHDAVEKLKAKLNDLEKTRNRIKQINKAIRKNEQIELTQTEKGDLESLEKVCGSYIFPPYVLTNLGQRIRNIKKRIEKISVTKKIKSKRYITLLSIAEEKKLNHGKSWKCTEKNINDHDLPGDYEGELICYVY